MAKTILLSAGHSDSDPGVTTVLKDSRGVPVVIREEDIGTDMRNMVGFYLGAAGIAYRMDGAGKENLPLTTAAKIARTVNIALEFHTNGVVNPAATGAEVLAGPKDMKLAARVSAAIADALGIRDRGAKPENAGHHSKLAFVGAGGLIVELFFLSNPDDLARWNARKWLVARAVADILIEEARK